MGIYDRPWYPEEQQPARPRSSMTPAVKVLLIINISVYVAQIVIFRSPQDSSWLLNNFGLRPYDVIAKFKIWQLVTSIFLHDPNSAFHLLFNMLVLWMFGPHVERRLGRKSFLRFYFGAGIAASICYTILGQFTGLATVAVGASGAIMGVIVYFTLLAPNAVVLFLLIIPMKMKWVTLLIVGIDLFGFLFGEGSNIAHTAHLGGALYGFLYFRYAHRLDRFFTQLEVGAKPREGARPSGRRPTEDDQRELNRLLDKINEEGFASLSKKEKKFLLETSRKLRETDE